MDIQQIKKLISWLEKRISLTDNDANLIKFDKPVPEDFIAAGFDDEMIEITLKASWWNEMVTDIIETPDFAEPDTSPETVSGYARDIITEYVNKRLLA